MLGDGCLGVLSVVEPASIGSEGMLDQPLTSLYVANKGSCMA
jgi:hypothetical protein